MRLAYSANCESPELDNDYWLLSTSATSASHTFLHAMQAYQYNMQASALAAFVMSGSASIS